MGRPPHDSGERSNERAYALLLVLVLAEEPQTQPTCCTPIATWPPLPSVSPGTTRTPKLAFQQPVYAHNTTAAANPSGVMV